MKKYLSVLLAVLIYVAAMPVHVSAAFALQPVAAVTVSDTPALQVPTATDKMKKKPQPKIKTKDGEYEITVDRSAAEKYAAQEKEQDSGLNLNKYKKLSLKYVAQYILFGTFLWSFRLYNKKKKGK